MNSRRSTNRKISHREPEHNETGYRGGTSSMKMHDSPASIGASRGAGPMPGAGEMPSKGPGFAAKSYAGRDPGESEIAKTPPGTAPKGMKVYAQE